MKFITGNKNKFEEVQAVLGDIEQLDLDLTEIQEIDAELIIKHKLQEALKHESGELIVEDTSLYLECMNGLPGPLIKWFLQTIGNNGLVRLTEQSGNNRATAKTIIGYAKSPEDITFFEGSISGTIVKQEAISTFGWDPIFEPDGCSQTFAQMSQEEKNKISMRRLALNKLKEYLDK